jgi:hypothetical protein
MPDELTQQGLEELDAELLPRREALSVIGPLLAAAAGSDAATDLPQMAEEEMPTLAGRPDGHLTAGTL